jgi:hypothetical protein
LTATIFDYARGSLGECISITETTPSISSAQIPANGTLSVTDTATVTVTGVSSFNGTLTFNLCGPFAALSTTLCGTGGVLISSSSVTSSPTVKTSDPATITEAGRYCWRADFSGDSTIGVPPSSDSRASECFTITPRTPALTTQAGASPVDFGNAVTDTATLTNTANEQGSGGPAGSTDGSINPATSGSAAKGTITFTLYKADCTTLATGTGSNPQTVNVSGDATYGPVSFTPNSPGTYHWVATYSGDLPNTTASDPNGADATCGQDVNEDVIVRQIPTTISTAQKTYPQDSATITSTVSGDNLPSNGTVTFSLYNSLANCQAGGATGRVYTQTINPVGGTHTATVNTSNSTFAVDAFTNGTYYWTVTYATGDTAHTGRQSVCTENVVLTFTDDAGPGSVFP